MTTAPSVLAALVRLAVVCALCAPVIAQQPAAAGRGRGPQPPDARVQQRSYQFADTNEALPYAVFVSSKVRPDRKSPLIVALHGLGGNPNSLLRGNALDLAEEGGYILVGPMGYNPGGWYGSPVISRGGGPPEPANLAELSEKDVLNVLALMRREFNVDENRTYVMGHSMGGAGALHMAVKHSANWAAVAAIAPAAFRLQPSSLGAVPAMPVMIVHGDMDNVVPVTVSRPWVEFMKSQKMTHAYIEVPGGDHGNVIGIGMPDIFTFFAQHSGPVRR